MNKIHFERTQNRNETTLSIISLPPSKPAETSKALRLAKRDREREKHCVNLLIKRKRIVYKNNVIKVFLTICDQNNV